MSIGNLKDNGGKGSNFNWQWRMLKILSDCCLGELIAQNITTEERNAIASPAVGLIVYDTDEDRLYVYKPSGWTVIV